MPTIDDLIKYHNENEYLDFKIEEYKEPKKHELIKDVLAFANAEYDGDRYIIIGIKKDGDNVIANDIINPADSAELQGYIIEYIKPDIRVEYFQYVFDNKKLMILKIISPKIQPYAIKR